MHLEAADYGPWAWIPETHVDELVPIFSLA